MREPIVETAERGSQTPSVLEGGLVVAMLGAAKGALLLLYTRRPRLWKIVLCGGLAFTMISLRTSNAAVVLPTYGLMLAVA